MGGGKSKKPLSVMDKEARKRTKEVVKKPREEKSEKRAVAELEISEQLMRRAAKVVSESKIVTPSSLASSLGVRVSLARAIMRELVKSGSASLISKHRGFLLVKAS